MGIDMSSAFDTIRCSTILDLLVELSVTVMKTKSV